jgi:hypothetical protein
MARTRHIVLLADPPMVRDALAAMKLSGAVASIARGANALGVWGDFPRPAQPRLPGWSAQARLGDGPKELLASGEWAVAFELSKRLQTAAAVFQCDDGKPSAAGVFEGGELVAFRCEGLEQNRDGELGPASGDVEAGVDQLLAAVVAEADAAGLARLISTEDYARRA